MTDHKPTSYSRTSSSIAEFDPAFLRAINSVCASISAAGYDPYSQLTGYLVTGNDAYITRSGNARAIIETLDRTQIQRYVNLHTNKS